MRNTREIAIKATKEADQAVMMAAHAAIAAANAAIAAANIYSAAITKAVRKANERKTTDVDAMADVNDITAVRQANEFATRTSEIYEVASRAAFKATLDAAKATAAIVLA